MKEQWVKENSLRRQPCRVRGPPDRYRGQEASPNSGQIQPNRSDAKSAIPRAPLRIADPEFKMAPKSGITTLPFLGRNYLPLYENAERGCPSRGFTATVCGPTGSGDCVQVAAPAVPIISQPYSTPCREISVNIRGRTPRWPTVNVGRMLLANSLSVRENGWASTVPDRHDSDRCPPLWAARHCDYCFQARCAPLGRAP